MKRMIFLSAFAVILANGPIALAHEVPSVMGHRESPREEMMEHMFQKTEIVASNDGGVIVLQGNKLYKYDKSLALIKSVEIGKAACCDMDMKKAGMLGKECPMHGKAMDKDCPMMHGKAMDKECPMMKKAAQEKEVVPAAVPAGSASQNFGPRK